MYIHFASSKAPEPSFHPVQRLQDVSGVLWAFRDAASISIDYGTAYRKI